MQLLVVGHRVEPLEEPVDLARGVGHAIERLDRGVAELLARLDVPRQRRLLPSARRVDPRADRDLADRDDRAEPELRLRLAAEEHRGNLALEREETHAPRVRADERRLDQVARRLEIEVASGELRQHDDLLRVEGDLHALAARFLQRQGDARHQVEVALGARHVERLGGEALGLEPVVARQGLLGLAHERLEGGGLG